MSRPSTALPADHFLAQLGIALDWDGSGSTGSISVDDTLRAAGSSRLRTALLATAVDVVAGHAPDGPVGPTIDLRLSLDSPAPTTGTIHLATRPLRVGGRLIVAETELRTDDETVPFARATTTFMNVRLGDGLASRPVPVPTMTERCFDDLVCFTRVDERTLEWHPDPRVMIHEGTVVQGGAQALVAELAAQQVLGAGPMVATDLDIRFLGRLREGPLVADVEQLHRHGDEIAGRVVLTNRDRERHGIVAFVNVTMTAAA